MILGLKLTHDAAVAAIHNDRLLFSIELEKIANGRRYKACNDLSEIDAVLASQDLDWWRFDHVIVDGWKHGAILPFGMNVAPYHEYDLGSGSPLLRMERVIVDGSAVLWRSCRHLASHVVGSYMVSPFAARSQSSYVITWDGGLQPRIHHVDPKTGDVTFIGPMFELYGVIYGIMGVYFGPYKMKHLPRADEITEEFVRGLPHAGLGGYDLPGKLMSYIALGKPDPRLMKVMEVQFKGSQFGLINDFGHALAYRRTGVPEHRLCRAIADVAEHDADALASIHTFIERELVNTAREMIPKGANLIFTGGSALNIKWNSALRESEHFKEVFVPPFPNDSGAAIGAAAVQAWNEGVRSLSWDVYSGPMLIKNSLPGWRPIECSARDVGKLLAARKDRAVVVLHGAAELGPRALGHRSIFMSSELASNKEFLNKIKRRENFRPVAPICLEKYAPNIFLPGTPDPWMLFDHMVVEQWKAIIPAIVHLDGTARLQTINDEQCPTTAQILTAHFEETGVPVLCNTSANLNGSGFFPDVASAQGWAAQVGVDRVWDGEHLWVPA